MGVVERGQQVPARPTRDTGSAYRLAVHRHPPPPGRRWTAAGLGPPAEQVVQGVGVHALQGPAERGLARDRIADTQLSQGRRVGVGGPLGDRGERPRPSQDRAHRHREYHRQTMTDSPSLARVGDLRKHREQAGPLTGQRFPNRDKVADRRVDP